VQTIFPEEKIRVAVFGFASLKTRPGNWAGLYSVSGNAFWIWVRSSFWFRVTDATTFWISIVGSGVLLMVSAFISSAFYRWGLGFISLFWGWGLISRCRGFVEAFRLLWPMVLRLVGDVSLIISITDL